jgi:hypothetical protein
LCSRCLCEIVLVYLRGFDNTLCFEHGDDTLLSHCLVALAIECRSIVLDIFSDVLVIGACTLLGYSGGLSVYGVVRLSVYFKI